MRHFDLILNEFTCGGNFKLTKDISILYTSCFFFTLDTFACLCINIS